MQKSKKTSRVLKNYICNPSTGTCENGKCLGSIIEVTKFSKKFSQKKPVPCRIKNFYLLLAFLLITIALLITVSVDWYLIKYFYHFTTPIRN